MKLTTESRQHGGGRNSNVTQGDLQLIETIKRERPTLSLREIYDGLRWLERVFRCYIVCETMKDYKEGCLMVWANYVSLQLYCWAIVKGTCDVISVTMATHKVHKSVL